MRYLLMAIAICGIFATASCSGTANVSLTPAPTRAASGTPVQPGDGSGSDIMGTPVQPGDGSGSDIMSTSP